MISTGYGRGTVYRLNDTTADDGSLHAESKNLTSTNLSDPQANVLYVTTSDDNETDLEGGTLQAQTKKPYKFKTVKTSQRGTCCSIFTFDKRNIKVIIKLYYAITVVAIYF